MTQCSTNDFVFQSTRPRGRTRRRSKDTVFPLWCFNPRVLAGGRDLKVVLMLRGISCFNPRVLAGGRDKCNVVYCDTVQVSIHASSREDATLTAYLLKRCSHVSIHASSREDATHYQRNMRRLRLFQSTRPRGRTRLAYMQERGWNNIVSIHASSREDATVRSSPCSRSSRFNPRVLAGGRDLAVDALF